MPFVHVAASPWALMEALAEQGSQPGDVFLHSGSDADGMGGRSFVAMAPWREIAVRGAEAQLWEDGRVVASQRGDVGQAIERWLHEAGVALHGTSRPVPWVGGYLGYELGLQLGAGHKVARRAATAAVPSLPDAWLGIYRAVCEWPRDAGAEVPGTLWLDDGYGLPARWRDGLARATARVECAVSSPATAGVALAPLTPSSPAAAYLGALERILAYIGAGDVYQVNLARQLQAPLANHQAFALYRALATVAPAPFGGVLWLAEGAIVTNSPELFLRKQPGSAQIETRPIKGTRRRVADAGAHVDANADAALAAELLANPKDGAEHDMIVDLERNDLGRICQIGSVQVAQHGYALTLPHLIHRVSRIQGMLRHDVGWASLLAATFPGGSITGAPKLRAMQLIAELEPFARGPYCGAIGYLRGGEVALSVAIRTAVVGGGRVTVTVGGGIVADSDPATELEETITKAMGFAAALRHMST